MEAFVSRKRRKLEKEGEKRDNADTTHQDEEQSTDLKLAILSSICENRAPDEILQALLNNDGSVERALDALISASDHESPRKKALSNATIGIQSSLNFKRTSSTDTTDTVDSARPPSLPSVPRPLTKKGRTLHLYHPAAVSQNTPCSLIHSFLPGSLATSLLQELLPETTSFGSAVFKLFDNVVQSPHTACFYVDSLAERERQKTDYLYNGSTLDDIREILPVMRQVSALVREAVNKEIATRVRDFYPEGKKLKYQSADEWIPNAAFVNCYDGAHQSVGYHSDQLTYLGPRAVIGSLSLGVEREFRVRRIVPKEEDQVPGSKAADEAADAQGQIAIHLPHNSLLVMHADMQEEWKHSIAPAQKITPHPVAGNKRINITYRWYREEFNPMYTPKCRCGLPCVLKTVQRQKTSKGRYLYMCQSGNRTDLGDTQGCGFLLFAQFDDNGAPVGWEERKAKYEKEKLDQEQDKKKDEDNLDH